MTPEERPGAFWNHIARGWSLYSQRTNRVIIYDCLEGILDDIALIYTSEIKAIAKTHIKIDKISTDILAALLYDYLLQRE